MPVLALRPKDIVPKTIPIFFINCSTRSRYLHLRESGRFLISAKDFDISIVSSTFSPSQNSFLDATASKDWLCFEGSSSVSIFIFFVSFSRLDSKMVIHALSAEPDLLA